MLNKKYSRDMTLHILLLLFTFGIYHIIWIYKTSEFNCEIDSDENLSPIAQTLLCMFIPFYVIFWYCRTADKIINNFDINDDSFKTTVLVGSIFVLPLASVLIQQKINESETVSKDVDCDDDYSALNEIKKYKQLLDVNAITQTEFNNKKKELLNI